MTSIQNPSAAVRLEPVQKHPNPHVQLEQVTREAAKLISLNGKLHWVSLASTTEKGQTQYHTLDKKIWDSLIPCIQRIFLAHQEITKDIDLTTKDISCVEIPLDDKTPIHYEKQGKSCDISSASMDLLKGKGTTPLLQYNHIKALRQILKQVPMTAYPIDKTLQQTHLNTFSDNYAIAWTHFEQLRTSLDKSMPEETFLFFTNELLKHSDFNALGHLEGDHGLKALKDALNSSAREQPITFLLATKPVESEPSYLVSITFDPQQHLLIVYDPANKKHRFKDNPFIQAILECHPKTTILCNADQKRITGQEHAYKKKLLLFLHNMLTSRTESEINKTYKQIDNTKWIQQKTHELIQKTHSEFYRTHEKIIALGSP